ncbi:MAG TPA: hypothetical protein VMT52_03755 [Planctomycetota bacterium]|nr:hypothetical protein [Planctomycetota bacterium]
MRKRRLDEPSPTGDWAPRTLEDHLLRRYLDDHPGTLFLEVPVGSSSEFAAPYVLHGEGEWERGF